MMLLRNLLVRRGKKRGEVDGTDLHSISSFLLLSFSSFPFLAQRVKKEKKERKRRPPLLLFFLLLFGTSYSHNGTLFFTVPLRNLELLRTNFVCLFLCFLASFFCR